jgi:hypothetical protein
MRAYFFIIALLVNASCTTQEPAQLATSLIGVQRATFLRCSGPPQLSMMQGDQEQMTFLSNRSQGTGLVSPAAMPLASCSGNATFLNGRLSSVSFDGDQTVCFDVFAPCQRGSGH